MYAANITSSMRRAIDETNRRRRKQVLFNKEHGITPRTIVKPIHSVIEATVAAEEGERYQPEDLKKLDRARARRMIGSLRKEMLKASKELAFERAAELRDMIYELEKQA